MDSPAIPTARDKLLFTPGPLTTSLTVKEAMLRDAGSWHYDFNALVTRVRERLVTEQMRQPTDGFTFTKHRCDHGSTPCRLKAGEE